MGSFEFWPPFMQSRLSLIRQRGFWSVQLTGWLLVTPLYFREAIESGLREELVWLTVTMTATSWIMAVACSSALAVAYLSMPPSSLTGLRAIPRVLGISVLAALPWTAVMTLLVASGTSFNLDLRQSYMRLMFFHAAVLMAVWSAAFLWFMRGARVPTWQTPLNPAQAWAPEVSLPSLTGNEKPTVKRVTVPWEGPDQVRLREGLTEKFCRVQDVAYVQAAGDYTEVHLANGEVAMVRQRLLHWESRLPETFARIHRSTIVNLELSEGLLRTDGVWQLRVRGCPEPLTVSRRLVQAIKAKLERQQGPLSM